MDGAGDLEEVGKSDFLSVYEDAIALFIVFDVFDHVSLKKLH